MSCDMTKQTSLISKIYIIPRSPPSSLSWDSALYQPEIDSDYRFHPSHQL